MGRVERVGRGRSARGDEGWAEEEGEEGEEEVGAEAGAVGGGGEGER